MDFRNKKPSDYFFMGFTSVIELSPRIPAYAIPQIPSCEIPEPTFCAIPQPSTYKIPEPTFCEIPQNSYNWFSDDAMALKTDWAKIGNDLDNALRKYAETLEKDS